MKPLLQKSPEAGATYAKKFVSGGHLFQLFIVFRHSTGCARAAAGHGGGTTSAGGVGALNP